MAQIPRMLQATWAASGVKLIVSQMLFQKPLRLISIRPYSKFAPIWPSMSRNDPSTAEQHSQGSVSQKGRHVHCNRIMYMASAAMAGMQWRSRKGVVLSQIPTSSYRCAHLTCGWYSASWSEISIEKTSRENTRVDAHQCESTVYRCIGPQAAV